MFTLFYLAPRIWDTDDARGYIAQTTRDRSKNRTFYSTEPPTKLDLRAPLDKAALAQTKDGSQFGGKC